MQIPFYKYQGTGNDFVVIDNRKQKWLTRSDTALVQKMCDRKFGVGADGLLLIQEKNGFDFEMIYFNSDGNESSMCGNGGRCIVAFANQLGIIEDRCRFSAIDGEHEATINKNNWVELKMSDVKTVKTAGDYFIMNTGSPHCVVFVENLNAVDVVKNGRQIRNSKLFKKQGINVDFVESNHGFLHIATYERGVEDETLSCGTGVTAAALSNYLKHPQLAEIQVPVIAKGGRLRVRFQPKGPSGFKDIWLGGPAEMVFNGTFPVR